MWGATELRWPHYLFASVVTIDIVLALADLYALRAGA
jgi:hypothetical protein